MVELKGPGRTLRQRATARHTFELVTFIDGSWAVRRDGTTLGVWEPHEKRDCVMTFRTLADGRCGPSHSSNSHVSYPRDANT